MCINLLFIKWDVGGFELIKGLGYGRKREYSGYLFW